MSGRQRKPSQGRKVAKERKKAAKRAAERLGARTYLTWHEVEELSRR